MAVTACRISRWAAPSAGSGSCSSCSRTSIPPANAGFVACDSDTRVISAGKGVFELTGYGEGELLGKPLVEAFGLSGFSADSNPVSVVMEWGVRKLDQPLMLRHRSGREKAVRVDLFPAYDEDGGLLASLAPRND